MYLYVKCKFHFDSWTCFIYVRGWNLSPKKKIKTTPIIILSIYECIFKSPTSVRFINMFVPFFLFLLLHIFFLSPYFFNGCVDIIYVLNEKKKLNRPIVIISCLAYPGIFHKKINTIFLHIFHIFLCKPFHVKKLFVVAIKLT